LTDKKNSVMIAPPKGNPLANYTARRGGFPQNKKIFLGDKIL
jgi:hypothetical protein